jgi:hypothetical protein
MQIASAAGWQSLLTCRRPVEPAEGCTMAGRERFAQLVQSSLAELKADLARLVAIPSVSAPGYPEETHGPLLEAHEGVAGLFRDAGAGVDALELPDTAPIVTGEVHPPA